MPLPARPRALLIVAIAIFAGVIGVAVSGVARSGRTPDARWPRVERDLRDYVELAMRRTASIAGRIARIPDVPRALERGGESPQALFQAIEAAVADADAGSLAVTIVGMSGSARAWHGRPSEPSRSLAVSTGRYFVSTGALGFRLARVEPVFSAAGSRVGAVIVEEEISGDRVGGWMSEAYAWHGGAGDVTLRPVTRAANAPAGEFTTVVRGPDGEPLVAASSTRAVLAENISRDQRRAFAVVLVVVAIGLLLAIGPLLDRRLAVRTAGQYAAVAGTVAALIVSVRALLWMATPWLSPAGGFAPRDAPGASVFLRSSGDFFLSAAALLAIAALAADAAFRTRVYWRLRRRPAAAAPVAYLTTQLAAGLLAGVLLCGADWLLNRAVQVAGADTIRLSLHPLAPDRWIGFCGFVIAGAAAVWLAVAVFIAALAPWLGPRRITRTFLIPFGIWLAAGAVAVVAARVVGGVWPSLMVPIAGVLAGLVAIDAPRVTARFRRAGVSARLSWFSLALLLPALVIYPSLQSAVEGVTRHIVESRYARETVNLTSDLQQTLQRTLREVDGIENLPLLFADGASAATTERAFAVWSQTALARERLTSSIELYAADGTLLSRFALNFPEYAAANQGTQSDSCRWQIFGEVRPFGAEERRGLYAERAVCADGRPVGSIAVHAMIDYNALRFISSESPYREVFRSPSPTTPVPGRPTALVIYGWSLLPIYSSGVQVWPIEEPLFERIYASRDGFWTTLRNRDGEFHAYIVNDPSGIYALGYPALTLFDHFVYLAELTMMGAIVYVLILIGSALETMLTRRRTPPARALLRDIRASFYRKLLIAFVLAAVVPVIALSVAIRQYFANRLRADIYAEAARTAGIAQNAIEELAALLRLAGLAAPPVNDDLMVEVSQMIGRDVNLFDGPRLIATSQRDLFASGLLPTRTPEDVYREIVLQGRPSYVGEDAIGDFRYMIAAAPVRATGAQAIATVPLASRQQEIEREIDDLDRGLLLAAVLFIIMGAAIGLPTAERIADPVRRLTRASRRIAHGDFDTRVAVHSIDELRRLVDAFNSMAAELKAQQQQLERTHRLEAWAEMARQVAHEIKNPLTPIQLSAEHLRRVHADRGEPLSPVLDACVDSILQQVRLLRQIAGEFSSFASAPTPRPARVSVPALIEEVVEPYRAGLANRIQLNVDLPSDLPPVRADATLVGRALTNVIDNALHAMPGLGSLFISAARANGTVAIAVRDTGVGMDADALQRVFEPYFSTKATGTGLGLTIARRNVELSGGTIAVESEKGSGTTVTIRLAMDQ